MHAVFLARELGITRGDGAALPRCFSAWGMLETEVRQDFSRAYFTPLAELDHGALARTAGRARGRGLRRLDDEGIRRRPVASSTRSTSAMSDRSTRSRCPFRAPASRSPRTSTKCSPRASTLRMRPALATPTRAHRSSSSHCGRRLWAISAGRSRRTRCRRRGGFPSRPPVIFGRAQARRVRRDDLPPGRRVNGPAIVSASRPPPPSYRPARRCASTRSGRCRS